MQCLFYLALALFFGLVTWLLVFGLLKCGFASCQEIFILKNEQLFFNQSFLDRQMNWNTNWILWLGNHKGLLNKHQLNCRKKTGYDETDRVKKYFFIKVINYQRKIYELT